MFFAMLPWDQHLTRIALPISLLSFLMFTFFLGPFSLAQDTSETPQVHQPMVPQQTLPLGQGTQVRHWVRADAASRVELL